MTVSAATFRQHFPAFGDPVRFPNAVVDYWISIGVNFINTDRWGALVDHGVELLTAHQLVLERKAMDEADNGGIPGVTTGPINNMSVDKVSVGYASELGGELDAGHWNDTVYGKRFIRTSRLMGAGPLQIGVPSDRTPGFGPWLGPWTGLFPNMNE